MRRVQVARVQQARADVDRVGALAERYAESLHALEARRADLAPALHALLAGVDHEVGDFPVERIALRVELLEPRQRVGGGEQRAVAIVAHALLEMRRAARAGRQPCRARRAAAVLLGEHRAAAGAEHDAVERAQLARSPATSRARKPASPSISKITGIRTPQRRSISWSESGTRASDAARAGGRRWSCRRPSCRPG